MTEELDPKGLIRESYRMEGLQEPECRSIFLDWALGLPADVDPKAAIATMLEVYGAEGHPMTKVLTEGLAEPQRRGRRGGARARSR